MIIKIKELKEEPAISSFLNYDAVSMRMFQIRWPEIAINN
jgi:hypothetical protein